MIRRIKTGWRLTGKSWQTLRSDKTLVLFPVVSFLATILALLVLLLPLGGLGVILGGDVVSGDILFYIGVFFYMLLTTFVAVFFNVALVSQVAESFRGQESSFKAGVKVAWSRKGVVFQWSVIAAVVGTVLKILEDRIPFLGAILSFLGGLAWAIAAWFVVPILALENESPIEALKKSVATVKKRWGEGVTGVVVIGGVFAILIFATVFLGIIIGILLASVSVSLAVAWGVLCFIALLVFAFTAAALRQIFDTAVYLSVTTEAESVGLFSRQDIEDAVVRKKKKGAEEIS